MIKSYSLLRLAEHEALSKVELSGQVLDLGGDKNSEYNKLFKGSFDIFSVNFSEASKPDLLHDLEKTPLPLDDASFDAVLMINLLEHIFSYGELLDEASRLLRKGGLMVLAVPFMFPVHPSPRDFNRFTDDAMVSMLKLRGFNNIVVNPLGKGVFTARVLFLHRLLPQPLRSVYGWLFFPVALINDLLFLKLARILGKKYSPSDYALGYVVTAQK